MSWIAPNLARQPFENLRPLRRVSISLLLVALLLTAWNVLTWQRTGAGAAEKSAELERLSAETARARDEIATVEADLITSDLDAMNEQVEFLNGVIGERTFSWNRLLDDVVGVLPPTVRIRQLTPEAAPARGAGAARSIRAAREERVRLGLVAEAEDGEQELALIDNLFRSPSFESPDLGRDTVQNDGLVRFNVDVVYRPRGGEEPAP